MRLVTTKLNSRELFTQSGLLAIAAGAVSVWVLTKPIVFTHDTFTYMEVARELDLGRSSNSYYFRLPIYPAILWAFHLIDLSHSVFWLIIFQSCLAVASVWLFYLSARLVEPRGAVIVALIFMASLLPFLNVKYIMTEQVFFFETMIALYGLIAYLMASSIRRALLSIVILTVGAALMMLTRPQGAYVGPVLLVTVAALAWRRAWIPLIGAALLITAVWSVQAIDQRARSGSWNSTGSFDNSHTAGKQLFFTFYLEGPSKVDIHVSPKNGPATAELKRLLLEEVVKPDNAARRKGHFSHKKPEEVPAYVEGMFDVQDSNLYWTAFYGLDERLGLKGADQLLLRVSLEAALAYPIGTAQLFLQKGFDVYFNPIELATPLHPQFAPGSFHPPLSKEIDAAGNFTDATEVDWLIDRIARWTMRVAILISVLTLPIALCYPTWRVTIALFIFGLYLNAVVTVGTLPIFRYAIYAIPVNLMCAFIGIISLISALWPLSLRLYPKFGDPMKG